MYRKGGLASPPVRFYTRTEDERNAEKNQTFEGAVVVSPKPGLYDKPTATLDWASLYPAIMVTHNFCPSTLVAPDCDLTIDPHIMRCADPVNELTLEERKRRAEDAVYTVADLKTEAPFSEAPLPDAPRFLKHGHKVGIMTQVQQDLLT